MASATPAMVTTTAVFDAGPHPVAQPKYLKSGKVLNPSSDPCVVPGLPRRLMVVTPTDAGTYPVVVFLHGYEIANCCYSQLLEHVASHGFIVVAPQLYIISAGLSDAKDIDGTRQVAAWLGDKKHGLSYVLDSVFQLQGKVKPDLSSLALAGHSRGGDTAFAVALGLPGKMPAPPAPHYKFSALIGVDPVAGLLSISGFHMQMEPKVLNFKSKPSLHTGMPVLVLGTGHGGILAPAGLNHVEFYNECVAPPHKYHFVVKKYGHLCMLDDDLERLGAHDDARRAMGGVMVAFLRAKLQHNDKDLNVVVSDPGLAPTKLKPVQHQ